MKTSGNKKMWVTI